MSFFSVPPVNFRNRNQVTARELALTLESLTAQLNNFASALKLKKLADGVQIEAKIITRPGSVVSAGSIDGRIIAGRLNKSAQTFNSDIVFSTLDFDTVQWTAGTIQFADGTRYAISSGNTGNMAALSFIYFEPVLSTSVLQVSTDYADTLGENSVLLANAKNAPSSDLAPFWVAYNSANLNINQLSVNYLAALSANMGDLTAGTITLTGAGSYFRMGATPPTSATVGTGLWIDYTGIYGLNANTQNFILSATTGQITALGVTVEGTIRAGTATGTRTELSSNSLLFYTELAGGPPATLGLSIVPSSYNGDGNTDVVLKVVDKISFVNSNLTVTYMYVDRLVTPEIVFPDKSVSFAKQIVSTLATGTAPLSVSSTTLCTNLNAQRLNGLLSSDFELANPNIQAHISSTSNPHSVTKTQVGLGSVENTALSTWAGTANITTVGTLTAGTLGAGFTAVADARIASSANWNTAYTDRLKWDGGATGLVAATGRTSLGLGTMATENVGGTQLISFRLADGSSSDVQFTNGKFISAS